MGIWSRGSWGFRHGGLTPPARLVESSIPLHQGDSLVLIIEDHLERLQQVAADVAEGVGGVEGAFVCCGEGSFDIFDTVAAEFEVFEFALLSFDHAADAASEGVLY